MFAVATVFTLPILSSATVFTVLLYPDGAAGSVYTKFIALLKAILLVILPSSSNGSSSVWIASWVKSNATLKSLFSLIWVAAAAFKLNVIVPLDAKDVAAE